MSDFVTVATIDDIDIDEVKIVEVEDRRLVIAHTKKGFYVVDDVCTHDNGPLGEGTLDGYELECPRHGARFDVRTGKALRFPAVAPINTYAVRVVGEEVQVSVPNRE